MSWHIKTAEIKHANKGIISFNDTNVVVGTCLSLRFASVFEQYSIDMQCLSVGNAFYSPWSISAFVDYLASDVSSPEDHILYDKDIDGLRFLPFATSGGNIFDDRKSLESALGKDVAYYRSAIQAAGSMTIFLGTTRTIMLKDKDVVIDRVSGLSSEMWRSTQHDVAQVISCLNETIRKLKTINPKLKIILAVDPQRYLFGFVDDPISDNLLSKSTLVSAANSVIDDGNDVYYFKSFETVYEELRHCEYINTRDLTHVNETTTEYLAEKFCDAFCSPQLRSDLKKYTSFKAFGYLKSISGDFSAQKSQMKTTLEILISKGVKDVPLHLLPLELLMRLYKLASFSGNEEFYEKINTHCRSDIRFPDEGFYVWGTGGRAKEECCIELTGFPGFLGYIDNDVSKHGKSFLGKKVHSPKVLENSKVKIVYVASTYYREIRQQIYQMNPSIVVRAVPSPL